VSGGRRYGGRVALLLYLAVLSGVFGPVTMLLVGATALELVGMAAQSAHDLVQLHYGVEVPPQPHTARAKHVALLKAFTGVAVLFLGLGLIEQPTWSAAWDKTCLVVTALVGGPVVAAAVRSYREVRRAAGDTTR
jgi:hypothetical protein